MLAAGGLLNGTLLPVSVQQRHISHARGPRLAIFNPRPQQPQCRARRIEPYGTDDEWYDIIDRAASRSWSSNGVGSPTPPPAATTQPSSTNAAAAACPSLEQQVAELRKTVQKQQQLIDKLLDADSVPSREADLLALYHALPDRLILIRHAESAGNTDVTTYRETPDPEVPLSERGLAQARAGGVKLRTLLEEDLEQRVLGSDSSCFNGGSNHHSNGSSSRSSSNVRCQRQQQAAEAAAAASGLSARNLLTFKISPYRRSQQTYQGISEAFPPWQLVDVREEVQLREQDFGNFQDPHRMAQDLKDRIKFGRFWFRFPNGESGADVYDRLTMFEDHLTRDMVMGRYRGLNIVLITHGLTLRIFLMRWFHWTTDQLLQVYNPPNAEPIILEKVTVSQALQLLRHAGKGQSSNTRGRGGYWGPYAAHHQQMSAGTGISALLSMDDAFGIGTLGGGAAAGQTVGRRLTHDLQTMQYTKRLYRMTPESILLLKGCSADMRGVEFSPSWD